MYVSRWVTMTRENPWAWVINWINIIHSLFSLTYSRLTQLMRFITLHWTIRTSELGSAFGRTVSDSSALVWTRCFWNNSSSNKNDFCFLIFSQKSRFEDSDLKISSWRKWKELRFIWALFWVRPDQLISLSVAYPSKKKNKF